MTAELHEYPKETYDSAITDIGYISDQTNIQNLYNSRLGHVYNLQLG